MSLIVYIYPHQGIACSHPASKDGLCGAHGREIEARTCVTYIAKSNNRSMKMTNQQADQDCAHMWKVDGGWWK